MTAPPLPTARHIELRLQRLDTGEIRVSTPQARGYAVVVRGPLQLWTAVAACYREATIAGRNRWNGEHYELDALTEVDDPTEPPRRDMPDADQLERRRVSYGKDRVVRPDESNPAAWTPNPDGSWTSPNGRRWTARKILEPLMIKRGRMGLSTSYEEWERAREEAAS